MRPNAPHNRLALERSGIASPKLTRLLCIIISTFGPHNTYQFVFVAAWNAEDCIEGLVHIRFDGRTLGIVLVLCHARRLQAPYMMQKSSAGINETLLHAVLLNVISRGKSTEKPSGLSWRWILHLWNGGPQSGCPNGMVIIPMCKVLPHGAARQFTGKGKHGFLDMVVMRQ